MSSNFALRLSDLRKEKNISQKEAASVLDVSQALLSHYEKGIRECGLDFLVRACDYYDVTSDYLLGISDSRHGLSDIYHDEELQSDSELRVKTMIRALLDITERLSAAGDAARDILRDELMLSVYRFALLCQKYGISDRTWYKLDSNEGDMLAAQILNKMFSDMRESEKSPEIAYNEQPQHIKTVIDNAEELIYAYYNKILS